MFVTKAIGYICRMTAIRKAEKRDVKPRTATRTPTLK